MRTNINRIGTKGKKLWSRNINTDEDDRGWNALNRNQSRILETLQIFRIYMIRKWTKNSVVVHQLSLNDGQERNCFCVENPSKSHSPLNVDLGVAPEKSQDFGQVSKQSLSDLAFGESAVATCNGQESFGRPVCKVVINGVNVNTEQVSRGMAWVYPKYASKFSVLYAYELKARSSRKGLWADKNPTPPWEYRHARK